MTIATSPLEDDHPPAPFGLPPGEAAEWELGFAVAVAVDYVRVFRKRPAP